MTEAQNLENRERILVALKQNYSLCPIAELKAELIDTEPDNALGLLKGFASDGRLIFGRAEDGTTYVLNPISLNQVIITDTKVEVITVDNVNGYIIQN